MGGSLQAIQHLQGQALIDAWLQFKTDLLEEGRRQAIQWRQARSAASAAEQAAQQRYRDLLAAIEAGGEPDVAALAAAATELANAVQDQAHHRGVPGLHLREQPAPHITSLIHPP